MLLTSDFSPTLFFSFELWALCLCFYRKLLFWNALQQLCFSKPGKLNPDIQRFWQKQPTCTYSARTICEILSFWSMWRIKANSTFWITKIMIHHHKRIIFFAISWPSGTHPDLISLIMKNTLLAGTVQCPSCTLLPPVSRLSISLLVTSLLYIIRVTGSNMITYQQVSVVDCNH